MQRHNALAAVLAIVGVAGESSILAGVLEHRYPYKMLTYPSPEFFAHAGNVVGSVLFAAFALAAVFLSRRSPVATPLILTVLLPLVFALALAVVTISSHGLHVGEPMNFDRYTIGQVLREFTTTAGFLSAVALFAGGLSSALVARVRTRQLAGG
jgi:hypothetical protein